MQIDRSFLWTRGTIKPRHLRGPRSVRVQRLDPEILIDLDTETAEIEIASFGTACNQTSNLGSTQVSSFVEHSAASGHVGAMRAMF